MEETMHSFLRWITFIEILVTCHKESHCMHQERQEAAPEQDKPLLMSGRQQNVTIRSLDSQDTATKDYDFLTTQCPALCYCYSTPNPNSHGALYLTTDCSNVDLQRIPQDISSSTQVLLLDRNKLNIDLPLHLPELCDLRILDVSHNLLYQIQNPLLDNVCSYNNLETLIITSSNVEYVDSRSFLQLSHVKTIKLNNNKIEMIHDEGFRGLHNLVNLDLTRNILFSLDPDWFQDLESLRELHLAQNNIHFLQSRVFVYLTQLILLDMSDNRLSHIYPQALYGLHNVRQVFLQGNHIKALLSDTFSYLRQADLIDVSNNHFEHLQAGCFRKINVVQLKVNKNEFLEVIDRSAFRELVSLKMLEIEGNHKLSYIDRGAIEKVPNLTHLSLGNNSLSSIEPKLLQNIPALNTLSLSGNEWSCDCHLQWLDDFLSHPLSGDPAHNISLINPAFAVCAKPNDKKGCMVHGADNGCDKSKANANDKKDTNHIQKEQSVESQDNTGSQCPPQVMALFGSSVSLVIGEKLVLHCRAIGQPKPDIEWVLPLGNKAKNQTILSPGQSLDNSGRISVTDSGSLLIEFVNHNDIGEHSCRVSNIHGSSQASCHIEIKNNLSKLIILRVTINSVTLTWKAAQNTHNTYQILYRHLASNSSYHSVDIQPYMKHYTVSDLLPGDQYDFCLALKHKTRSLIINCTSVGTYLVSHIHQGAIHDITWYLIAGALLTFCVLFVLVCIGHQVASKYNRKCHLQQQMIGDQMSEMFLDSYSELSPMTYENRFAIMFDDSDLDEIQASAAEAAEGLK